MYKFIWLVVVGLLQDKLSESIDYLQFVIIISPVHTAIFLSKLLIVCNLFESCIYLKYCSNNNQPIKQYLENPRCQKLPKMWLENIACSLNGTTDIYLSFESLYCYRCWYILMHNVTYKQLQKSLSHHVVLKGTNR
jgi:hypothetical protein